jgi:hypothetical protein
VTLALTIQDQPGGTTQPDLTSRLTRCTFSTGAHGYEACQVSAAIALPAAFERYDRAGLPHALITDGAAAPFQGRVEDTSIRTDGVDMTAFGYQRALSDSPYTALWSVTDVSKFRPATESDLAAFSPAQYAIDTNNRIAISLPQGQVYTSGGAANIGAVVYQKPEGGSRQIIGMMFDAVCTLPANWLFYFNQYQSGWTGVVPTTIFTSGGATTVLNKFYTFAGCDYINIGVINNTGGNYLVNNAPNVWQVIITNVRLVTTTANKVDTTTTGAVGAGAGVSVPVVTSARMYVGQRLHIGIPAANGFAAIVSSVPDSTHFVADLSAAIGAGVNVQAHIVYADEIVKDLISTVAALNSTQLSSSTVQVQSPALDLLDERYEDMLPNAILDHLIGLGDNQTPPRQWEWGVYDAQLLFFQPEGTNARTWYVDISALELQRTIDQLVNSAYAVYQEAGGRPLRGSVSAVSTSVTRYGLTRRQAVNVSTTSLTQANVQRDAVLNDQDDPPPRFGITFDRIFTVTGASAPIWLPRAGDTIVIRNLPPTLSIDIDQIRTFRIARTSCDVIARTLTVEPLTPLPSLTAMLSKAAPPSWVTTPWWQQVQQK